MPDIVIIRRRDRVYIIGETVHGAKFLKENFIGYDNYLNSPAEVAEELIAAFRLEGLSVEEP